MNWGLLGTWLGTVISLISFAAAYMFYRKGSIDLTGATTELRSELRNQREIGQFMVRGLARMGIAEPQTDEFGFVTSYRIRDEHGSEAVYLPGEHGPSAFRVISGRPQSAPPEWEQSGLSQSALDLLNWMSFQWTNGIDESNAAEFIYRGPADIRKTRTVCHPGTKKCFSAEVNVLRELLDEHYVETPDDSGVGQGGKVFLSLESTQEIFPWMRN